VETLDAGSPEFVEVELEGWLELLVGSRSKDAEELKDQLVFQASGEQSGCSPLA